MPVIFVKPSFLKCYVFSGSHCWDVRTERRQKQQQQKQTFEVGQNGVIYVQYRTSVKVVCVYLWTVLLSAELPRLFVECRLQKEFNV
jgi:hypothetical protein